MKTIPEISERFWLDEAPRSRRRVKLAVALVYRVDYCRCSSYTATWYQTPRFSTRLLESHAGITVTVTATGTVQPVNQLDVATEISGTIRTVEVDYNDRVKVGQVLARIDTEKLQAQVSQSQST